MKILLTGSSGRLGSAVLPEFAKLSWDVLALGRRPLIEQDVIVVDFDNYNDLEPVFMRERPDIVVHAAAVVGSECEKDTEQAHKTNIDLTRHLAELADRYCVNKFIFISTAAIYDQVVLSPTDEYSNISPHSLYGKTKQLAERELELIAAKSTTNFISLRVFNIYGPGFNSSLINELTESTKNTPVDLFGYENFYRDYISVYDVVQSIVDCINIDMSKFEKKYAVYNIGSGESISNQDLVDSIKKHGSEAHYNVVGDKQSYSWADISRARDELGFLPKVTTTELLD